MLKFVIQIIEYTSNNKNDVIYYFNILLKYFKRRGNELIL